jgi:uncharacterized protein involved in exopolysaccharide biosynthesis
MFVPSNTVPAANVLRVVRQHWKRLLVLVLVPALAGLVVALTRPHRYDAEVVVLPRVQEHSGLLNSLGGQLGGLAALAGLSLGEGGQRSEAIEMLQSRVLARQFILDKSLLPVLFAGDWDAKRQAWRGRPRTINDAVDRFDHNIRKVMEDRRTGLVTIRISWRDPSVAAAWANELVHRANEELRQRAIARAQGSIDYLKRQARNADTIEIQLTMYRLMEDQYKTLLLANVSADYAFSIIDPAVALDPDQYASPRLSVFVLAGLFLGLVLAGLVVFLMAPQPSVDASQVGRDR